MPADPGCDVNVNMLPILRERTALPALGFNPLEPTLRSLGNGRALTRGGVDAFADVYPNSRVVVVGVLLARKGLDVPITVLIGVINDPSFLGLALSRGPLAFAY